MPSDRSPAERNPYQTPISVGEGDDLRQRRGMVNHAMPVGILMMVQGALNCLVGGLAVIYAVIVPSAIAQAQQANQPGQPQLTPDMGLMFAVGGGIVAFVMIGLGLLWIYSGISVTRFKRRTLAIVSLASGMVTLVTCYCFPTSLIMAIYGLIFLINPSVTTAFQMRSEGKSVDDIRREFLSLH